MSYALQRFFFFLKYICLALGVVLDELVNSSLWLKYDLLLFHNDFLTPVNIDISLKRRDFCARILTFSSGMRGGGEILIAQVKKLKV